MCRGNARVHEIARSDVEMSEFTKKRKMEHAEFLSQLNKLSVDDCFTYFNGSEELGPKAHKIPWLSEELREHKAIMSGCHDLRSLWTWAKQNGNTNFYHWNFHVDLARSGGDDGVFIFNVKSCDNIVKLTDEGIAFTYTETNMETGEAVEVSEFVLK